MLAIIGGTSLSGADFIEGLREKTIETEWGECHLLENTEVVYLPRHGRKRNIPPHRINHKANISALSKLGVEEIIGAGSCGSLKEDIPPGSFAVPGDYMNLSEIESFFNEEIRHVVPGLDPGLKGNLISACEKAGVSAFEDKTYLQSRGPRLETRAEVRFMRDYADLVGMTLASEATLAGEQGMKYAGLCTVDNYAHGIGEHMISYESIKSGAEKNQGILEKIINAFIEEKR